MFLKYIKTSITFDLEILYGVGGAEKNSPPSEEAGPPKNHGLLACDSEKLKTHKWLDKL